MNEPKAIREPVDLTNCDREPIHLLGRVQHYGFLLATTSDWIVSHVSSNLDAFVDADPHGLIGEPVSEFLDQAIIHKLRNCLQHQGSSGLPEVVACASLARAIDDRRFDISVHTSGQSIILEFEPSNSPEDADRSVTAVQQAIQRASGLDSVDKILKFATRFSAALTGFDRVMAYVFRDDGSGEVRAEAHAPGMEPFLGLRYPASDIPKQARSLYIQNPVRSIDDTSSLGSPILPKSDNLEEQLDLSGAVLRSVSPIHLEYLQNMGVGASMSLSLVVEGRLWGLIACHHQQPKHLFQVQRNAFVLFAQMLSLIISNKIAAEDNLYQSTAANLINQFSRSAATTGDISSVVIQQHDTAMELMSAAGLSVVCNGKIDCVGLTPAEEDITTLVKRLNTLAAGEIYATSELTKLLPQAAGFVDRAAGMLSIPISRKPRDYILFFRPEVVKSVKWAGNPEKPVTVGPNGIRLTPRKSFETWQTLVEGQSEEWSKSEIAAAEQFRVTVLEVVLRMADEAAQERSRANEKQELLIAELNHRVRNILGLVRSLISQTSKSGGSVEEFSRVLESRVHALARAHDQITMQNWSASSLKKLVETEAKAYLHDKSSRVVLAGPDVMLVPIAYSNLALVMHEMITNSAKYGSLSDRRGRVDIQLASREDGSLDIFWQELDGPAVREPERRGFGSTIIERSIPFELQGESAIEYDSAGVKARFWIPAVHIAGIGDDQQSIPQSESDNASSDDDKDAGSSFPKHVLLVEDNLIIAMDTESVLLELGAESVGICADVASSVNAIDERKPDFALLDINLGGETSLEVARKLEALNIPYVLASGYGESHPFGDAGIKRNVITKPYDKDTLKKAVLAALQP